MNNQALRSTHKKRASSPYPFTVRVSHHGKPHGICVVPNTVSHSGKLYMFRARTTVILEAYSQPRPSVALRAPMNGASRQDLFYFPASRASSLPRSLPFARRSYKLSPGNHRRTNKAPAVPRNARRYGYYRKWRT